MPSAIKNPFKRNKSVANNDKVVLKKADKSTTEISIARVERSQVSPEPVPRVVEDPLFMMDVPALRRLLQQRDDQIASLKNEMAAMTSRLDELELQSNLCTCGAYQGEQGGPKLNTNFSRW